MAIDAQTTELSKPPKAEVVSAIAGLTVVGLGLLGALYLYSTGHLTYEITTLYGPTKPELVALNPEAILRDLIKISSDLKTLLTH